MQGDLTGKVALVTGGASGIGRAVVEALCAAGAKVAIADIDEGAISKTLESLSAQGFMATGVAGSVEKNADAQRFVERTVAEFGRLDIVYHSAGIGSTGSILEVSEDEWDRVMSINVKGIYLVSRAAVARMGEGGSIVTVSSLAGMVGGPRMAAYNASKGAVVLLSKNMAIDFAPRGIRVNCICPGTTRTPLVEALLDQRQRLGEPLEDMLNPQRYPMGRFARLDEVASLVVFLASDASSFITGATIPIDGGFTSW